MYSMLTDYDKKTWMEEGETHNVTETQLVAVFRFR